MAGINFFACMVVGVFFQASGVVKFFVTEEAFVGFFAFMDSDMFF